MRVIAMVEVLLDKTSGDLTGSAAANILDNLSMAVRDQSRASLIHAELAAKRSGLEV